MKNLKQETILFEETLCQLGETQHTVKYGPFIEGGRIKDTILTVNKSLFKLAEDLPLYIKFTAIRTDLIDGESSTKRKK